MDFLEDGSWSLSFAGAGFLGLYHAGVIHCLRQRAPRLLRGARRIYSSSSGAIGAMAIVFDQYLDLCCSLCLHMVKQLEQLSLGIFHPAYAPTDSIRQMLRDTLPRDSHILASQRLGISITHWPDGSNCIVTNFASREELIQALVCTMYIPFYGGVIPPEFRGERYLDGALSDNLPFSDTRSTITVSPFPGPVDICPRSRSASLQELHIFNMRLQVSMENLALAMKALVVVDTCRQGYLDALRFLETRGLTKEPMLWTLVSREPLAPAAGTKASSHDQGQPASPALSWATPSVRVKDVPDWEQLSPELDAALKKACQEDPQPWAGFRGSALGRVLACLLLPCTLPFEFVYFRSKKLLLWLPEAPADLCWLRDLLKRVALELCAKTRVQLFRPGSLLATRVVNVDSLQPRAAASVDQAMDPESTHEACRRRAGASPVSGQI